MSESFCGKSCDECTYKARLTCPGCKSGPGGITEGECGIADCCRQKVFTQCSECASRQNCRLFEGRGNLPERKLRARESERDMERRLSDRAFFLRRWIVVLFVLMIPLVLAALPEFESAGIKLLEFESKALRGHDYFVGYVSVIPALVYSVGRIAGFVCMLIYAVTLRVLGSKEEWYKYASFFTFAAGLGSLIITVIKRPRETPDWFVFILVSIALLGIIGAYCECRAHANVLSGVDDRLSAKWVSLRRRLVCFGVCLIIGALLISIFPILGVAAMFAGMFGTIVVNAAKLVWLLRTARRF